jgi:DNA modification methylase
MAKTEEDLRKSRENRERIIAELGLIPESIILHNKSDRAIDLMTENGRSYSATQGRFTGEGHLANSKAFTFSGPNCRTNDENGALSRFPQNVGRILLKLYTKTGDTVVDPFAGHNSRMELCWRSGRNYIGQDLSRKFMEANRQIREMLLGEVATDLFPQTHSQAFITLHEGDSRQMLAADCSGDFTITSPPYWNIEYYGNEPEQLGAGDYDSFLKGLAQVAAENFRCLKPGAFCVWCVNDFRADGKFHSYHEHTCGLLREAGFYQWDIAITDLGSSFGAAFAQQVMDRKILPKRHEYCLIFRKP